METTVDTERALAAQPAPELEFEFTELEARLAPSLLAACSCACQCSPCCGTPACSSCQSCFWPSA